MNSLESLYSSSIQAIEQRYGLSLDQFPQLDFALNVDESKASFGHASWNVALVLAKYLKQNPRVVAQQILELIAQQPGITKLEIAGPGFINFFFTQHLFTELAQQVMELGPDFFKPLLKTSHNYSLEFVSANPTGPLHLGHGRGGIIGDVLARVLRFIGHNVTTEFYVNDAGSQIAKLGLSLKARCMQALGHDVQLPEDGYQGEYLKEFAQLCLAEFGNDVINQPDNFFATFAKERLLALIKDTLQQYGIMFDVWFSEKSLHDDSTVATVIDALKQRDLIYTNENALWFRSSVYGDDKDRVVQKTDGEYTYLASDIAYLENKLKRGFNKIILILGQDHHSYVTRMKALMMAMGNKADDLHVILYQLVTLKEADIPVRMSKRTGKIVSLQDVIEAVGTDVARFFYLHRKADAHLDFDVALALKKTEENPVFYIQYAHVRTASILEKAALEKSLVDIGPADCAPHSTEDFALLKKIVSLKSLLETIGRTYQTHLLAYYAQELAQTFHHYYRHQRVLDLEQIQQTRQRLALVVITRNTLKLCLDLLGLSAPTSM